MKLSAELLSSVSQQLQLSEEDRNKLVDITMALQNGGEDEEINIKTKLRMATTAMLHLFGSCKTSDDLITYANTKIQKTRMAYDQVLSAQLVRPIPIFTGVRTELELEMVNKWLENEWMCDREISDRYYTDQKIRMNAYKNEVKFSERNQDGELTFIDINPVTEQRRKTIEAILTRNNITRPECLFNKRYMNCLFKSKGNLDECIGKSVEKKWETFYCLSFKIKDDIYTKVGNHLQPKITEDSLIYYGETFCKIFGGHEINTNRLERILNIISSTEDIVDVEKYSTYQMLVKDLFKIDILKHSLFLFKQTQEANMLKQQKQQLQLTSSLSKLPSQQQQPPPPPQPTITITNNNNRKKNPQNNKSLTQTCQIITHYPK